MSEQEEYNPRLEHFTDWKGDHLSGLRSDFIQKQTKAKLLEYVVSETEESFCDYFNDEFEEYCETTYNEEMQQ